MNQSVDALLSAFNAEEDEDTLTIDISPFVSGDAAMREIKWARPDVPALYAVGTDALKVQDKFVGMPDQMALEVSLMAHCHTAANGPPVSGQTLPIIFYASLAMSKKHGKPWMLLSQSIRNWLPDAWAFLINADNLKKILLTSQDSASSTPEGTP